MAKKKTYTAADLNAKTVKELNVIASALKIPKYKSLKKVDLLDALQGKTILESEEEVKKVITKPTESKIKPEAEKPKAKKKKEVKVITPGKTLVKFHRNHPKRSSMTWR